MKVDFPNLGDTVNDLRVKDGEVPRKLQSIERKVLRLEMVSRTHNVLKRLVVVKTDVVVGLCLTPDTIGEVHQPKSINIHPNSLIGCHVY